MFIGIQKDIYHKSSDKFCIQGGSIAAVAANTGAKVTLKKAFKNTSYIVNCNVVQTATSFTNSTVIWAKTSVTSTSTFIVQSGYGENVGNTYPCKWTAYGFVA